MRLILRIYALVIEFLSSIIFGPRTPKMQVKGTKQHIYDAEQVKCDPLNEVYMQFKLSPKNVDTYTDIYALLDYLIKNNMYFAHIRSINRVSADEISAMEEHTLLNPIKFTMKLPNKSNTHAEKEIQAELYFNSPVTALVCSTRDRLVCSTRDPLVFENNIKSARVIQLQSLIMDDRCIKLISRVTLLEGSGLKMFEELTKKFNHSFFIDLVKIVSGDKVSFSIAYSINGSSIYDIWSCGMYNNFFDKVMFLWFIVWFLERDGNQGFINLLRLINDENENIMIFDYKIRVHETKVIGAEKIGTFTRDIIAAINGSDFKAAEFLGLCRERLNIIYKSIIGVDMDSVLLSRWISLDREYQSKYNSRGAHIVLKGHLDRLTLYQCGREWLSAIKAEYFKGLRAVESHNDVSVNTIERTTSNNFVTQHSKKKYKSMEYLFLRVEEKRKLEAILLNYRNNTELYQKLGLTHKISLILHGMSGTGKSTSILAIASFLQKTVYYINNQSINWNDENMGIIEDYLNFLSTISVGSIVVLEDIDLLKTSDVIKFLERMTVVEDLVVIMTTNDITKVDQSICQPGKVDALVEFGNCDTQVISTIFETMFHRKPCPEIIGKVIPNKFTAAEIIYGFLPRLYAQPTMLSELDIKELDYEILSDFM